MNELELIQTYEKYNGQIALKQIEKREREKAFKEYIAKLTKDFNESQAIITNEIEELRNQKYDNIENKTITINFYDVDGYKFVDLPGYGYAKLSKSERDRFGELMEGYFQSERNIKLVVQLVDMRHKPSQDDFGMIDFMQQMDIPFIVVCTKADKLKVKEFKRREKEIKEELSMVDENLIIPFSSQSGLGLDTVKMLIEKSLGA